MPPAMSARRSRGAGCCRVAAVVRVDGRGQLVIPGELRRAAGIGPGERMALLTWERGGRVCCLALVRAEELSDAAGRALQPFLGPAQGKKGG